MPGLGLYVPHPKTHITLIQWVGELSTGLYVPHTTNMF